MLQECSQEFLKNTKDCKHIERTRNNLAHIWNDYDMLVSFICNMTSFFKAEMEKEDVDSKNIPIEDKERYYFSRGLRTGFMAAYATFNDEVIAHDRRINGKLE